MALVKRIFKIKKDIGWSLWLYIDLRGCSCSYGIRLTFLVLKVGIFFNNRQSNIVPRSEQKLKSPDFNNLGILVFVSKRSKPTAWLTLGIEYGVEKMLRGTQ
jgi:hypothetical protein